MKLIWNKSGLKKLTHGTSHLKNLPMIIWKFLSKSLSKLLRAKKRTRHPISFYTPSNMILSPRFLVALQSRVLTFKPSNWCHIKYSKSESDYLRPPKYFWLNRNNKGRKSSWKTQSRKISRRCFFSTLWYSLRQGTKTSMDLICRTQGNSLR